MEFDWIINYDCNYRCKYCWYFGQWKQLEESVSQIPYEGIINFWERIYNEYNKAKIIISGGEPFLYPRFTELMLTISKLHEIVVITNLSIYPDDLVKYAYKNNIEINASFHPDFANYNKFKKYAIDLKNNGLLYDITCLAWPPYIKNIEDFRKEFSDLGFNFSARPFYGLYDDRIYPESYTEEEKRIIENKNNSEKDLKNQFQKDIKTSEFNASIAKVKNTKNKLCYAGSKFANIEQDGKIYRCGTDKKYIGQITDNEIPFYSEAKRCREERCMCNRWQGLLVEDE